MCVLCQKQQCPSTCPNHLPPKKLNLRRAGRPRCLLCGEKIESGALYYQRNGFPYCFDCMEVIDTDSLIRICESERKEWLQNMGFCCEIND